MRSDQKVATWYRSMKLTFSDLCVVFSIFPKAVHCSCVPGNVMVHSLHSRTALGKDALLRPAMFIARTWNS